MKLALLLASSVGLVFMLVFLIAFIRQAYLYRAPVRVSRISDVIEAEAEPEESKRRAA